MVEGLRYEENGRVATFTLDRPDRLNALTFDIYAELRDRFAALRKNDGVQSVVITGTGRGFCSGGDVEDIIGKLLAMESEELLAFTTMTCDVVQNMRACPQPIVAALNGTVAGAGSALALASDFRLAAPEAKVAFLFVKAGLSAADMGACHLLPRIVGLGRATELLMLGDFILAEEAHRIGLYNRIVPRESLMAEARALAERLAAGPGMGIAVSKQTLNAQLDMSLDDALAWDAKVQAACMLSPDFREAYESFRDKRPAKYAPRPTRSG